MFSTHSAVTQLKPATVVQCVQAAEEAQYGQGDVFGSSLGASGSGSTGVTSTRARCPSSDGGELGTALLGCGSCVQDIHAYFSILESRTCRVNLGVRRTQNSIRPVPKLAHSDDGSAKASRLPMEVLYLDSRDLRVFRHAYLCAVYPVLAAPGPPSPISPPPDPRHSSQRSASSSSAAAMAATGDLSCEKSDGASEEAYGRRVFPSPDHIGATKLLNPRNMSPYAFHDSGVEESDEAGLIGLIPMESICQLLQRAFGLSNTLFRQYEAIIVRAYAKAKKSSQKLLAEELTGQLIVLENNSHPFYAPSHFITRNGYDLWQKQERMHIAELLAKFWQYNLPYPRDHQDRIAELKSVHEDYQILLKKLLDYESKYREEADGTSAMTFTPLSSASCRLLLEFGLRYGIGEMFRKTLLLQNLISEFSPTVGYLTYVNNLVLSIKCMLPSNKAAVVMVKQELDVLHSSLRVLKTQTCKALNQMKDLFSENIPANGIGLLLGLLKSVMTLMGYLAPSNAQVESYRTCVQDTVLGIFKPRYERIKAAVRADCNQDRGEHINPQMLNIMIADISAEVVDFRNNFEGMFQRFFSITKMAALSFYQLLMQDVEVFCQNSTSSKIEIDRQTLALAYRLNQLDSEWASCILPRHQTWRVSFLPKLDEWTDALRHKAQQFILKAVPADPYLSQKMELPHPLLTYQDQSQVSDRHSCSISVVSITPSVNSAFSSIMSSIRSTPCHASNISPQKTITEISSKPQSAFKKRISTLHKSQSRDIKVDQATDKFLQEGEPVTFSSSLDNSHVKNTDSVEDHNCQMSSISLPDTLNRMNVANNSTRSKSNIVAKISAWREEVAKHQPQLHRQGNYIDSLERQSRGPPASHLSLNLSTKSFTPASVSEEEMKGSGSTLGSEAFSFPPLRPDSQPTGMSDIIDFSQPVFQKPHSLHAESNEPVNFHGRTATSSLLNRSSTMLDRQNLAVLSSLGVGTSDSTITMTDTKEAILSISGSLIDVLVLLQRLCGFSTNIVGIILSIEASQPETPRKSSLSRLTSKESISESREFDCKSQKLSAKTDGSSRSVSDKSFTSSGPEAQYALPDFKSWESLSTSFSTLNLNNKEVEKESFRVNELQSLSNREHTKSESDSMDIGETSVKRDTRQSVVRVPSRIGPIPVEPSVEQQENQELPKSDHYPVKNFSKLRTRLRLHLQALGTMSNILTVYSTNVLCMDLCGTPKAVAKKLIGANLVNFVRHQQATGVVWGCRHQTEVPYGCLYYFNRRVDYLCERYEPVTQNMCTRINNAFACLHILDEFCSRLASIFGLEKADQDGAEENEELLDEEDIEVRENKEASGKSDGIASQNTSSFSEYCIISSSSGYLTSEAMAGLEQEPRRVIDRPMPSAQPLQTGAEHFEDSYVSSEEDLLSDNVRANPISLRQRWRTQAQRGSAATKHHLLATVTGMCRLMAYKLNLFVRDGLPMLLHLRDPCVTMDACLSPITTFMHRYLDSLSSWLYRDCFRRVLDYLWVLIVQDIEFHADRLLKAESSASSQAHDWMLAISVLIKFMNNNGRGIKKELLLSQANDVIFRLQLFTLSSQRLIILYQKLKDYHMEVDELTLEENTSRSPPAIIHRIHGELQSLRKCFSGAELVRWIVKNRSALPADLSVPDEDITKEVAVDIAQDLLDNNFIMELESALQTESNTPTSLVDHLSPYPQLSVHSRVASEAEDESWDASDGHPPGQSHQSSCEQGISSSHWASHAGSNMDTVFEERAEVYNFPPLGRRSTTPTMPSSSSESCLPSPGQAYINRPSPIDVGDRTARPPSMSAPTVQDRMSPGPMDHSSANDRNCPTLGETSGQMLEGCAENGSSPNKTPTLSRNHSPEDIDSSTGQHQGQETGAARQSPQQESEISVEATTTASSKSGAGLDKHVLSAAEPDLLSSLCSRASVADFRSTATRPQPHCQETAYGQLRKTHSDSLTSGSSELLGPPELGNGVSPFSSIADLEYLNNRKFIASSKRFYFIHQSVLNPSLSIFRQWQHNDLLHRNHRHAHRRLGVHHQAQQQGKTRHNHRRNYQPEASGPRSEFSGSLSAPTLSASTNLERQPAASGAASTIPSAPQNVGGDLERERNGDRSDISLHQKNALENLALVEQCISHKITPDRIAAIIVGRRKTNNLAKNFFKHYTSG